jgi:hypothetical protein
MFARMCVRFVTVVGSGSEQAASAVRIWYAVVSYRGMIGPL